MKPKTLKKKLNFKKVTIARLDQKGIKAGILTYPTCGMPTCHLTCGTCETCPDTCDGATCGPACTNLPALCNTIPTCNPC